MAEEHDYTDDELIDEDESENSAAALKKLRERLKQALKEKQEYLDGWQRARAEFSNYKRQEAALSSEKESRMRAEVLEALLPSLDALELAVKHDGNATIKMLEKQFLESLRQLGAERFGAVGDMLDPRLHEALGQKHVDEEEKNHTVLSVERSGYRIGNTVIRPAQVIMGIYKA